VRDGDSDGVGDSDKVTDSVALREPLGLAKDAVRSPDLVAVGLFEGVSVGVSDKDDEVVFVPSEVTVAVAVLAAESVAAVRDSDGDRLGVRDVVSVRLKVRVRVSASVGVFVSRFDTDGVMRREVVSDGVPLCDCDLDSDKLRVSGSERVWVIGSEIVST